MREASLYISKIILQLSTQKLYEMKSCEIELPPSDLYEQKKVDEFVAVAARND